MCFILKIVYLLHHLLFEGFGTEGGVAFEEGTEMGLVLEAEAVGDLLDGK